MAPCVTNSATATASESPAAIETSWSVRGPPGVSPNTPPDLRSIEVSTKPESAAVGPRSSNLLHRVGDAVANALAGLIAAVAAIAWIVVGIIAGFPTWWQISLYSATATVTFVMVFVIQHTQSRQIAALQRKLDELIRSSHQADNSLIAVEHAPEEELQQLADTYRDQRNEAVGD
jgi:low affinity Fe/Cu permease